VKSFPVFLKLKAQPCLVIGPGREFWARVAALLRAGARVTVLAPELPPEVAAQVETGALAWIPRHPREGDLEGFFLVVSCLDDREANRRLFAEAQRRGVLFNALDDPGHANFSFPARLQRGPLTLAIATEGKAPALAVRLKEKLARIIGPEYGALAELMAEVRPEVTDRIKAFADRRRLWYRIVDSQVLEYLRAGQEARARALIREMIERAREEVAHETDG